MQGVNVFENGIGYLTKCLGLYNSGTGYFVMYLFAVLFILIKGERQEREIFLPGAAVLLLTVFNPVVPVILDRIFDVSSEYYRLFWIAPVVILVPYTATIIIYDRPKGSGRYVAGVLTVALLILGGNYVYAKGFDIAENIYKIPDELIAVSEMIHEDSQEEYSKAFFEYEYNMEIRQYDPKMLLTVDREDYLYAMNYSYTDEMLANEDRPVDRILALLVRNQNISEEDFTLALEKTDTEYVVLTAGHPQIPFIKRAGLYEIGRVGTHIVFKYDLDDPAVFELVDYSDVQHRFSYRRLK